MKNLAIIPCKRHSSRISDKNIRDFFGYPLFMHTVNQAVKSNAFDEVLISTESDEIADISKQYGHVIPFLRSEALTREGTTMDQYIEEVLNEYEARGKTFDTICLLLVTAPLRLPDDILACYEMLDESTDGVVSVTEYDHSVFHSLWMDDGQYVSMVQPEYSNVLVSLHPKVYVDNSSILMKRVTSFRRDKNFFSGRVRGYHMPQSRSVDINTMEDWDLVEYYYQKRQKVEELSS